MIWCDWCDQRKSLPVMSVVHTAASLPQFATASGGVSGSPCSPATGKHQSFSVRHKLGIFNVISQIYWLIITDHVYLTSHY